MKSNYYLYFIDIIKNLFVVKIHRFVKWYFYHIQEKKKLIKYPTNKLELVRQKNKNQA